MFYQSQNVGGHVGMGCVNKVITVDVVVILVVCATVAVFYVVLVVIIMLLLILFTTSYFLYYTFKYSSCSCVLLCNSLLFV